MKLLYITKDGGTFTVSQYSGPTFLPLVFFLYPSRVLPELPSSPPESKNSGDGGHGTRGEGYQILGLLLIEKNGACSLPYDEQISKKKGENIY